MDGLGFDMKQKQLLILLKAVLVLKYIVPDYPFPTLYFGVANTIANGLIMLRYLMVLLKSNMSLMSFQLCCALGITEYGG